MAVCTRTNELVPAHRCPLDSLAPMSEPSAGSTPSTVPEAEVSIDEALVHRFDAEHHDAIWDAYEPTESTLIRAKAWTVSYGAMLFEAGRTGDRYLEAAGSDALRRLLS